MKKGERRRERADIPPRQRLPDRGAFEKVLAVGMSVAHGRRWRVRGRVREHRTRRKGGGCVRQGVRKGEGHKGEAECKWEAARTQVRTRCRSAGEGE